MSQPFVGQGIGQPYYGSDIYGGTVYGSAYPAPATQAVGRPAFYAAIVARLASANIFAPSSVFWAIDPDSDIQWPSGPPPFCMIVPRASSNVGDDEGGGRFSKLRSMRIDVHVIVSNVYDSAFRDTGAVTSSSVSVGAFALLDAIVDNLEQAYIRTADGRYATVEMPRSTGTGEIHRFKQTSAYISIPETFEMIVEQALPSTLFATAMPPDPEDF